MRIGAVADIHGNLPALRAVVDEMRACHVDRVICCGDIASGPLPTQTIDYLLELEIPFQSVRGNADRGAFWSYDGHQDHHTFHEDDIWTGTQLASNHRDYLAGLPPTITLEAAGLGRILVCHGTPRRDDEVVVETTPTAQLEDALADVEADIVLCGNTHMQFDRVVAGTRIVNVGSVGWPYGTPGAYWALLDEGIELRRTQYNLAAAERDLRAGSSWPRIETFLSYLSAPASREEAIAFFERATR